MAVAEDHSPHASSLPRGWRRAPGWPDPASGKKVRLHQVASADGTVIEAWTNGVEGPTVLLCNGLAANAYAWPELLDPRCGLRVVSWNHRGVGRSARPADLSRIGVDAFVEDAVAVLDEFGVDRCVVAGWSTGVTTAFEVALRNPQRVIGLFAVGGVPGGTSASVAGPLLIPRPLREPVTTGVARGLQAWGPALTPLVRRLSMGPVSTTLLRCSGFMLPTASAPDVRRAVREFLTTPVDWFGTLALAAKEPPRHRSASRLQVPARFVAGRFDLMASHRDIRTAAEQLPGGSYVQLAGGHFLPLENPRKVTRLLRELVESAEASRGS